jgi:hypothetical protein
LKHTNITGKKAIKRSYYTQKKEKIGKSVELTQREEEKTLMHLTK